MDRRGFGKAGLALAAGVVAGRGAFAQQQRTVGVSLSSDTNTGTSHGVPAMSGMSRQAKVASRMSIGGSCPVWRPRASWPRAFASGPIPG